MTVGVDPAEDRKRFHVTEKGVTLITPDMLGQQVHHAALTGAQPAGWCFTSPRCTRA